MTAALVEIELDLGGSGEGHLDASELGRVLADARDLGALTVPGAGPWPPSVTTLQRRIHPPCSLPGVTF